MKGTVKKLYVFLLAVTASVPCLAQQGNGDTKDLEAFTDHVFHLSEVMLRDATSPPAACRVYAYATLGAYEVASMLKGRAPHLNKRLRVDPNIKPVTVPRKADLAFCSNYAMMEIGRQLMPSGYMLEEKK